MNRLLILLTLLGLAACGSALETPASAVSSTAATSSSKSRDCGWVARSDANLLNILYPDRYATYWVAVLPIPPGGEVLLDGQYPHARYASFNLYNPRLEPLDALADVEIVPNAGSTQPFALGALRNAAVRDYRVHVVAGVRPDQRAANTLYSFQTLGPVTQGSPLAIAIYRVYVEDQGQDVSGGVGLPKISFKLANGQVLSGTDACTLLEQVPTLPAADTLNNLDPPIETQPNTAAFAKLQWLKFFDLQGSQANRFNATPLGPVLSGALGQSTANSGGFASNVHNNYIYATASQSLGEVAAIRLRVPTTPKTHDNVAVMGDGQLRYWSLCSNEANTQRYIDCLYDEQVTRDASDTAIILVSRNADRPANARPECGVTWLNWGPFSNSLLIYRHMLPRADFAQAIQRIPGPAGAHEQETMGSYFPSGQHMGKLDFERLGCPVNPDTLG